MSYVARKILEHLFGKDKLSSSVVGRSRIRNISYVKFNVPEVSQKQAVDALFRLRRKNIIRYKEIGDNVQIVLTENGQKKLLS